MQIRFVNTGELSAAAGDSPAELTLFGFDGMGEVSYEKELKGESDCFERAARLSKREESVVISGCFTNAKWHLRKSAVVAEKGKLLGVSDMLHSTDGKYASGAELRIYPTSLGKIGVLVAEDAYFPERTGALTLCGADFLVCPYEHIDERALVLFRARALESGAPLFFCGRGYAGIASPKGELAFATPQSPIVTDYTWRKEYRLIERRKRGLI